MIHLFRDQSGALSAHYVYSDRWSQLSGAPDGTPPANLKPMGMLGIIPESTRAGLFTPWTMTANWVDPDAGLQLDVSRAELQRALPNFIEEVEETDSGSNQITEGWRSALKAGKSHWTYIYWPCVIHDVLASAAWIGVLVLWPRAKRERAYERAYNDYFGLKCPACGYPREGLATETCPECGRVNSMPEILCASGAEREQNEGPKVT
ncbi:MAG: hypothetical protein U0638_08270 [Phycisphaerales bacterium]